MQTQTYNILTSSWPSAGGTTMTLMLANFLKLKYIYAGGVLKEWASRMGYDPKSNEFHDWEKEYGEHWDKFWESYILWKLGDKKGFVYEGKTSGFLLPGDIAFEVMLVASEEARASRASGDGRVEEIHERDLILAERWERLFGIKFLSLEAIKENYEIMLDTSYLTLTQSFLEVLVALKYWLVDHQLSHELFNLGEAEKYASEYDKLLSTRQDVKVKLKADLEKEELYIDNPTIFMEFSSNKELAEKFSLLPQAMQDACKPTLN
jgi:cytidylate kinase